MKVFAGRFGLTLLLVLVLDVLRFGAISGQERVLAFLNGNGTALLVILTAVLAGATWGLFERTARLADDGQQQIIQFERHHRQSTSSYLVLADQVIGLEEDSEEVTLSGELRNLGTGPAFAVEIEMRLASGERGRRNLNSLMGGEKRALSKRAVISVSRVDGRDSESIVNNAVVEVKWTTLFDAVGKATYTFRTGLGWLGDLQFPETEDKSKE